MRISYDWLKEFVEIREKPLEVAEILTFLGFETAIVPDCSREWKNVVVARVTDVQKHPNADKLTVCRVSDGAKTYSIVCGAPNVAKDQVVPLALDGAELPGGLKIKSTKLRGVDSQGMICSAKELGISSDCSGIMVLGSEHKPGQALSEAIGDTDVIFEVETPTNRGDVLSHWGIAREMAGKLQKKTRLPDIPSYKFDGKVKIKIEDNELCERYIGHLIRGIKAGPSPDWMQKRLEKCGLRPINNIVDITNYVLLELGHPLHAFDLKVMDGSEIIVRRAKQGESIAALDGKKYPLSETMLVIADKSGPQAIAGVMGGERSGVTESTCDIILESAVFKPSSVRRTAKSLGISTDASYRFERGCGSSVCELASFRAARLIEEIAGGKLESSSDVSKKVCEPVVIDLRFDRANKLLGTDFSKKEILDSVSWLGMKIKESGGKINAEIPSWRNDLLCEADLIEEVARMRGYDKIPETVPPVKPDISAGRMKKDVKNILRNGFVSNGFCDAMNNSFCEEKDLKVFGLSAANRIANPLSRENEVLRPSLVVWLYKNVSLNLAHGYESVRLFETGTVFMQEGEKQMLAFMAAGRAFPEWWGAGQSADFNFYLASGLLQNVFAGNTVGIKSDEKTEKYFHPGKSASIYVNGARVGSFGMLSPRLNVNGREVCYGEVDLAVAESAWKTETSRYQKLVSYPKVQRDLSIIIDKNVPFDDVYKTINGLCAQGILKECEIFSQYGDEKIGKNKISYSFHMAFQHPERTLTDTEVNGLVDKIVKELNSKFGVTLR